jgi:hypothetical protein
LLQERKEQIDFLQENKLLYSEISSLELILEGYQKWFEGTKCSPPRQANVIQQLEHCRVKIKAMKSHEDSINKMKKRAADLSLSQFAKSDTDNINIDVNHFLERWGELMLRCVLLLSLSLSVRIYMFTVLQINDSVSEKRKSMKPLLYILQ